MKTLELNNLPAPVLLVWGLPEDACFITMAYPAKALYYSENDASEWARIAKGEWQIISKLSELTEDQAKGLVHNSIHTGLSAHYTKGVNPTNVYCYKAGLKSLHSAIEAEGYYVENPWPEPEIENYLSGRQYKYFLHKWQDDRSKTLPANTLIFKKS